MNGAIKPFSADLVAGVCLRIYQHSPARLKIFPVNDCNPDGTPDYLLCFSFDSLSIGYCSIKSHLAFKISKWIE